MYKHWVLCANVYRLRSCVDKWYMGNVHKTYIVHIIHEHKTNTQRFLIKQFCPSVIKNTRGLNLLENLYCKGVELSPFKWVIGQCCFAVMILISVDKTDLYASPLFSVTMQNHTFSTKRASKFCSVHLAVFLIALFKWSSGHLKMFFSPLPKWNKIKWIHWKP